MQHLAMSHLFLLELRHHVPPCLRLIEIPYEDVSVNSSCISVMSSGGVSSGGESCDVIFSDRCFAPACNPHPHLSFDGSCKQGRVTTIIDDVHSSSHTGKDSVRRLSI